MVMSWSWPGVVTRVSRHHTFVTLVTCHTPWHVTQPSTHVTHCTHRTLFWFPLINNIISTRNIESCTYIDILCIKLESYLSLVLLFVRSLFDPLTHYTRPTPCCPWVRAEDERVPAGLSFRLRLSFCVAVLERTPPASHPLLGTQSTIQYYTGEK